MTERGEKRFRCTVTKTTPLRPLLFSFHPPQLLPVSDVGQVPKKHDQITVGDGISDLANEDAERSGLVAAAGENHTREKCEGQDVVYQNRHVVQTKTQHVNHVLEQIAVGKHQAEDALRRVLAGDVWLCEFPTGTPPVLHQGVEGETAGWDGVDHGDYG